MLGDPATHAKHLTKRSPSPTPKASLLHYSSCKAPATPASRLQSQTNWSTAFANEASTSDTTYSKMTATDSPTERTNPADEEIAGFLILHLL